LFFNQNMNVFLGRCPRRYLLVEVVQLAIGMMIMPTLTLLRERVAPLLLIVRIKQLRKFIVVVTKRKGGCNRGNRNNRNSCRRTWCGRRRHCHCSNRRGHGDWRGREDRSGLGLSSTVLGARRRENSLTATAVT
jgi:hypothetical protein